MFKFMVLASDCSSTSICSCLGPDLCSMWHLVECGVEYRAPAPSGIGMEAKISSRLVALCF